MRIGIDAGCWANRRGYGRYTRELVNALLAIDSRNEYTLVIDSETERHCDSLPPGANRLVVPVSIAASEGASASGHRSVRDLWAMHRAVARRGSAFDLFYFPSVYTFFPVPSRIRPLVTIHDTIAERYPTLVFPHKHNQLFWNLKVRYAVRQARLILTVSETAKGDLMDRFGIEAPRLRVIPDAVGPEFTPPERRADAASVLSKYGLSTDSRFLLYVGGVSPHKNLETLIAAFDMLLRQPQTSDLHLVIAGDVAGDVFLSSAESVRRCVETVSAIDRVIFTGYVPDKELPQWYGAARALVLPSFDEGFGLPAIEAMACGTPVVVSRAGALPEVVSDAGLLFDPRSPDDLARTLSRLLGDAALHAALSAKGVARASVFTWRTSAQLALNVFEEAGSDRAIPT